MLCLDVNFVKSQHVSLYTFLGCDILFSGLWYTMAVINSLHFNRAELVVLLLVLPALQCDVYHWTQVLPPCWDCQSCYNYLQAVRLQQYSSILPQQLSSAACNAGSSTWVWVLSNPNFYSQVFNSDASKDSKAGILHLAMCWWRNNCGFVQELRLKY